MIWEKRLLGRGYSRCKGPEAGISLVCSVKTRKASVTREMWVRRRVGQRSWRGSLRGKSFWS